MIQPTLVERIPHLIGLESHGPVELDKEALCQQRYHDTDGDVLYRLPADTLNIRHGRNVERRTHRVVKKSSAPGFIWYREEVYDDA